MSEITREEFVTSRNTWDPTKLDSPEGASDLMINQFSPIPSDMIDSFYNDQGDIRATKSDSKVDPAVVDSEVGPVVGDSKVDSKVDPDVVESEVGPAVVENNKRYHPKPTGEEYRSKPKKKKRNQRQLINNKIRWKDQPQIPSFPDHLLHKNDPIEGVPSAVAKELQSLLDRAQVYGMEQIDDSVYYDSNGEATDDDEDDDSTFQNAIQVEDAIYDTDDDVDESLIYKETINNNFTVPVGTKDGATGVTIEYDGVLHVQYCHFGEIYYQSCEIYGDDPDKTDEAIEMMPTSVNHGLFVTVLLLYKVIPYLASAQKRNINRKWNMIGK